MTKEPELFRPLQNKGLSFLVDASARLSKTCRFPFVLILTCDRAEILAEREAQPETLERALSLNTLKVKKHRYSLEQTEKEILVFATGVTSPLFGEDTIQGQIAMAAEASRLAGTSSPYLRKLLSSAVAFSKRMHTEHKLRVFDKTIVDEIEKRVEGLGRILIIGSGESARAIAERLRERHDVTMTLRDTDKLFLLPPGIKALSYDKRFDAVDDNDAVISATSGLYHSFEEEDLYLLSGKLVFDLSSPPDLPEGSAVTVDDLGIALPEKERIVQIVNEEAEKDAAKIALWRKNSGEWEKLNGKAEDIAAETIRRLSSPIKDLGLAEKEEIKFRNALSDSVRKAVITESLRNQDKTVDGSPVLM